MNTVIQQICKLSGPLPDELAFRRYLEGLTQQQLFDRLEALKADRPGARRAAAPAPMYMRRWPRAYGRGESLSVLTLKAGA